MYHLIVKELTRKNFEHVANGNFETVLAGCSPNMRHVFHGDHALGGERNDLNSFKLWLERVARLSPQFSFEIHNIFVEGGPWRTKIVVQWTKHDKNPNGIIDSSWGIHLITLEWFQTTVIEVFPDTAGTIAEMQTKGFYGMEEALAAPIVS